MLSEYLSLDQLSCYSLPPEAYTDLDLHALELDAIFRKEWLCVGRAEYIPAPGDYYCIDILNESLVVVQGQDGVIRALSNICRHRFMPVAQGSGNTKRFVCPYHAWTYETDGSLYAAPFMKGSSVFDKSLCSLPSYRLESWCGFLFINLDDDAPPLLDKMQTADKYLVNYRLNEQTEIMHYQTEWAGNWKLSAENSMEYYHHVGYIKIQLEGSYPQKTRIYRQALRAVLSRMNDVGWMMPTSEVKTILSTRWVIWIRFLPKTCIPATWCTSFRHLRWLCAPTPITG